MWSSSSNWIFYVNRVILILKLNLTSMRNLYIKRCMPCGALRRPLLMYMFIIEVKFNLRMRIMLFVNMSFLWVTTTLSSLRTTTCDVLIVPSGFMFISLPYSSFQFKGTQLLYGSVLQKKFIYTNQYFCISNMYVLRVSNIYSICGQVSVIIHCCYAWFYFVFARY